MKSSLLRTLGLIAVALGFAGVDAGAATFQFEVLGASSDHVVLRENLPARASDVAACAYPGLDPSQYTGVSVRFVKLGDAAKQGGLTVLAKDSSDTVLPIHTPAPQGPGCTSAEDAERRWREVRSRASELGIALAEKAPEPVVLGKAVPASACVLIAEQPSADKACRAVYAQTLAGGPIRIALALSAVPEAPDLKTCQFIGHRFGVALQVDGLDFGTVGGSAAPGGFANHYDCRGQEFAPLRLYPLAGTAVLLGGFRGTNMADRSEHPFLIAIPTEPAP